MYERSLDRELLLIQAVNFINNVLYEIRPYNDGFDIYLRHDNFVGIVHDSSKPSIKIIY